MRTAARPCVLALPALLLTLLATAACDLNLTGQGLNLDTVRATDTWTRSYTLSAGGTLAIVNRNGRIEVGPATGSEVEVRAERRARASSRSAARALLERIDMHEQVAADRVSIEAELPRAERNGWFDFNTGADVQYFVRVPAGLRLVLDTRNGGIRLSNVDGAISVTTRNGGIDGERLSGSIKASAVNGGMRIAMAAVTGDVDLSLRNGGIRLEIPTGARVTLDARSRNGGISIDDDLALQETENSRDHERGREDRRRLTGTVNGGGARITATTVNGGIRIRSGQGQRS